MAFNGIDDFDSYTTAANLNTLNGGSGWSGAWTYEGGGTMTIETAPAGGQGGKAVRSQSAVVDTVYARTFTATNVGTVGVRMRISITNPNDNVSVTVRQGTTPVIYLRFGPTANIEIFNGSGASSWDSIGSYAVDTWYTMEIEWDNPGHPDTFRARVDSGTWSAWVGAATNSITTLDTFRLVDAATNAHTTWFDDIGLLGSTAGATLMGAMCL